MNPVSILDYLDGHLSPEDRAAMEVRLAEDAGLRAELAALVEIRAALRSGVAPEPVGQSCTLDALRSLRVPWYARWQTGHWVALAGAATLSVGIWVTVRGSEPQSTSRMMLASDSTAYVTRPLQAEVASRSGSMAISVPSIESALRVAGRVARGCQGTLQVLNHADGLVEAEVRVPAHAFDRAWEALLPLGQVEASSVFEGHESAPGSATTVIRVRILAGGAAPSASLPSP